MGGNGSNVVREQGELCLHVLEESHGLLEGAPQLLMVSLQQINICTLQIYKVRKRMGLTEEIWTNFNEL